MSPPPTTAISRSLEEEAVAGRAGRHAAAAQPRLAVEAEPQRRRAGGDDHGLGPVLGAARPDAERALGEVHAVDVDVDEPRPEALGLGADRGHQVGALDAVREARVVLDVAGEHQLAAGGGAGEDDRLEVGARGVDRGGQAGRAGADDDDLGIDAALAAGDGRRAAGLGGRRRSVAGIEMLKPSNGFEIDRPPSVGSSVMSAIVARMRYSLGVCSGEWRGHSPGAAG